ncbi:MAG: Slp family lipoprotein, partial [Nitrospira sp.]|nr:Slp family lipoprotein [Nitrospira sp.]
QIDASVGFAALQAAPDNYIGKIVMAGGIVISARRTKDQTEIEVLQLPAEAGSPSKTERLRSEGRFLAVREAFLDPASVPPGTPITVVGEVTGSLVRPLDESTYRYPVLEIKHLTDWNTVAAQHSGGHAAVYYGPSYPPYYWWGPYGYYSYPFLIQPRPSAPPPRPQNIPPQFKKRR